MRDKEKMPYWFENLPPFKDRKKPTKITKEMEVTNTYGIDGNDIMSYFFVCTDIVNSAAYICPPGQRLIPPGIHCSDEVYYVSRGEAIIRNPETGQAVRVKKGSAVAIPKGTMHEVYNFCEESLYVWTFIHKVWRQEEWGKLEGMVSDNK